MDKKNVVVEFSFKTVLWALVIIVALWLFVALKDVFFSVLLAFILAMAISPLVDRLQKKKVPRTVSILGVLLVVLGVGYLAIRLIVPPFITEISNIVANRTEYVSIITGYLQNLSPTMRDGLTNSLDNFLGSFGSLNLSGLVSGAQNVFSGIVNVILVVIICFYLLQSDKGLEGLVDAYLPKPQRSRALSLYRKISEKMSQWMRGQLLLGLIIFVINLIGLSILKVDYALTLAVLSGLLEVLPIIGPIISGGLAVLIALTQSPLLALIVLAWFILVQQAENHILVPQVMKKSLGLNPIVVILAVIIGGKLLGIIGILVAVPVIAAIGVLMGEFIKKQEREAK